MQNQFGGCGKFCKWNSPREEPVLGRESRLSVCGIMDSRDYASMVYFLSVITNPFLDSTIGGFFFLLKALLLWIISPDHSLPNQHIFVLANFSRSSLKEREGGQFVCWSNGKPQPAAASPHFAAAAAMCKPDVTARTHARERETEIPLSSRAVPFQVCIRAVFLLSAKTIGAELSLTTTTTTLLPM